MFIFECWALPPPPTQSIGFIVVSKNSRFIHLSVAEVAKKFENVKSRASTFLKYLKDEKMNKLLFFIFLFTIFFTVAV